MTNTNDPEQMNHENIAVLAYQIWEQRGHPDGCDIECWLEAERKILASGDPSVAQPAAPEVADLLVVPTRQNRVCSPIPSSAGKQPVKAKPEVKPTVHSTMFAPREAKLAEVPTTAKREATGRR